MALAFPASSIFACVVVAHAGVRRYDQVLPGKLDHRHLTHMAHHKVVLGSDNFSLRVQSSIIRDHSRVVADLKKEVLTNTVIKCAHARAFVCFIDR